MQLAEAADVAMQVASALAAAHADGIVHRDIKPENIMLRRDGYVKVLDFGLAKLTESQLELQNLETEARVQTNPGIVMGTVAYMSPEQSRGHPMDQRSDLWSLGVVLFEMVTGRVPFAGETPSHVIVAILESEPPLMAHYIELPARLEAIVVKALRKNKDKRYQTASDLAIDLKNLKQDLEAQARENRAPNEHRSVEISRKRNGLDAVHPSSTRTANVIPRQTSSAEYLISEIRRHKRVSLFAVASTIIGLAVVFYFVYIRGVGQYFAMSRESIDSVAVLPFVNVSGDPKTEYLSEGITDSIINGLSPLSNLRVMSLNSVLPYRGRPIDPQVVGHELNVRAVVLSRVVQQGDNLAITIELVDVRDNSRLWGAQFNRKLSDILVVQNEIALEISDKLRLRLSGEEKQQLVKRYTQNTDAYLLFQQGRELLRTRTREGTEKGIAYFEEAIKKDPSYALARVWLATAYLDYSSPLPFRQARQKVETQLLKALEVDNDLAEAHALLGGIRQDDGDWLTAERECKHAIDLDQNSVLARAYYVGYLRRTGRHDEAIAATEQALELDPFSAKEHADVGYELFFARRYEPAIEQFKQAIDIDPNYAPAHARLGATYLQKKLYEEAILELEKARSLDNSPERQGRFAWLAYAFAMSGQQAKAKLMLAELKEQATQRNIPPISFAYIYTGLGEKDKAFAWLEKLYEEGNGRDLGEVNVNPMFDSLHSDPRFTNLMRRVNLAP